MNRFKKIGRQVLFLETGKNSPRYGEGAFLRLKNNSILHVYTAYYGDDWGDHCQADLCGRISEDEGESWSNEFTVLKKPEKALNVMSVSLLRMGNGDIGLFYIEKLPYKDNKTADRYCLIRSGDEGKSWSEPVTCIPDGEYHVINNDRVVMLKNGHIIIAASRHPINENVKGLNKGRINYFVSKDDGLSFQKTDCELVTPFPDISIGLQEPGVYQLEDGTLWSYFRTNLGYQYESFSNDEGNTWTDPRPNLTFSSPTSPMLVKDAGRFTLAVFNPVPHIVIADKGFGMDRTPYMLAVSDDKGKSFKRFYLIENDTSNSYCYPAIIEGDGYFLISYYHSNNTRQFLNCEKIVKITYDEISD